jgi:hypothetical protein
MSPQKREDTKESEEWEKEKETPPQEQAAEDLPDSQMRDQDKNRSDD